MLCEYLLKLFPLRRRKNELMRRRGGNSAINTGHDQYDIEKCDNVFAAAKETGFPLFFSFDLVSFFPFFSWKWRSHVSLHFSAPLQSTQRIKLDSIRLPLALRHERRVLQDRQQSGRFNFLWRSTRFLHRRRWFFQRSERSMATRDRYGKDF